MNIVLSKYCLDYKNNQDLTLLSVLLPTMNRYLKNFDETKTMFFLVDDEKKKQSNMEQRLKNYKKEKNPIVAQFFMTSILTIKKDENDYQNVKNDSATPPEEGSVLKAIINMD